MPITYSPRHPLQDTTLHVEVAEYDPTVHPREISYFGHRWLETGRQLRTEYLDDAGRITLRFRLSVVMRCGLMYADGVANFLQQPGEATYLRIATTASGYKLEVIGNSFVDQSYRLLSDEVVGPEGNAFHRAADSRDLSIYQEAAQRYETALAERLTRSLQRHSITNALILDYGRQFIKYAVKYDVCLYPVTITQPGPEQHRLLQLARFADTPQVLEEGPVYCDDYLEYVYLGILQLEQDIDTAYRRGSAAWFAEADRVYRTISHPFTEAFLRARLLYAALRTLTDDVILQTTEAFLEDCPYPLIREPLQKRLDLVTGPTPEEFYTERLLSLPAGVDNPIPALLERHAGKVVVLDVWSSWCGPCVIELQQGYPQLAAKYADLPVAFVFLSADKQENLWREAVSELPECGEHLRLNPTQLLVVADLLGVSGYPHHAVFDQRGGPVVTDAHGGLELLGNLINQLLA
ncbi:TlpA family protein disulfide reductase [Neolewinella sp.]|uniref:TlpA family protein disulfide reductase n=1 Tax=Neolewinella sp. TaxID=2993543 RepID=UPI003B52097C